MKKNITKIIFLIILAICFSCEEEILNKTPPGEFTEAVIWQDINLADAYLNNIYGSVRGGFGEAMLATISDEVWPIYSRSSHIWNEGLISPSNPGPWGQGGFFSHTSWDLYGTIQLINVFLEKIDEIPEAYPEAEKQEIQETVDRMKGEAIFLRAFFYSNLARSYGGVPLITSPNVLNDDYSQIERATFEETINFIVEETDRAAELLLNKGEIQMGRANKGAALALKSRILLFAASDLTADGTAANEYVGYETPDRTDLWTAARDAAKDVLDLNFILEDFGAPDKEAVAENYYDFFRAYDLSSDEVIWGKMYLNTVGDQHQMNLWMGPNGNHEWGGLNPTQDLVNAYQMEDGSDFTEHFAMDEEGRYINTSTMFNKQSPYKNREPRFHASILYDSIVWQERFPELQNRDPLGIYERRSHVVTNPDGTETEVPGIDTRQGPIASWNGSYTGYLLKKFLDDEIVGRYDYNENVWIEFRLAEVILNYAEASLELGQTSEAAKYINMIRNRSALPDFQGDITKALRYERRIELVFEQHRWYDMRRWKILDETIHDVKGMTIIETRNGEEVSTIWREHFVGIRGPVEEKMYWIPITQDEISRAPQLIQNPGY